MTAQSSSPNTQPSTHADQRLEAVLDAHGGRPSWARVVAIEGRLSCGGFALASRLQRNALRHLHIRVEPRARRVTLHDFGQPGWIGQWTPDRVTLHDPDRLVEERTAPRAHFRRLANVVAWDRLDVLYFAGYALWNYLCFPFVLAEPGVAVTFPDRADGRDGQRLVVDFPPDVPTHSPRQAFHLDRENRLLRHDYTAEVYGRWADVANLADASTVSGGHRFYTRRRAYPRLGPWQTVLPFPLVIRIELDDLVVMTEEGATR